MSGGSCIVRLTTAGGPIGGRRFSRMNIIRMNSSRHAFRGRISGGGNGWQVPHTAFACCSSAAIDPGLCGSCLTAVIDGDGRSIATIWTAAHAATIA